MRLSAVLLTLLLSASLPLTARADDQKPISARIANPSHAPALLQSAHAEWLCVGGGTWQCNVGNGRWGSRIRFLMGISNQTSHQLLSFDVQYTAFDAENAKISQAVQSIILDAPLSRGEKQVLQSPDETGTGTNFNFSEPPSAVSYVSVKILKASFTGNRLWVAGQPWPE